MKINKHYLSILGSVLLTINHNTKFPLYGIEIIFALMMYYAVIVVGLSVIIFICNKLKQIIPGGDKTHGST